MSTESQKTTAVASGGVKQSWLTRLVSYFPEDRKNRRDRVSSESVIEVSKNHSGFGF